MAPGESMKYDVRTDIEGACITSTLDMVHADGVRETIMRQVLDTQEVAVRDALKKLGWRAPGEIAAIDIPCALSYDDPLKQRYRRITADDVVRMEQQLAAIRRVIQD